MRLSQSTSSHTHKLTRTRTGGHDQHGRARVDRHVARHQTDVLELLVQLAVLLIAERLDR